MTSSATQSSSPDASRMTPATFAAAAFFLGVICCVFGIYLLAGFGYALLATSGFFFLVAAIFVRGVARGG